MLEKLCTTSREVDIAFAILFAALIAVSIGKGGGKLLLDLLKKLVGHESVSINLAGGEMAKIPKECESCGLVVDPTKCVMHQSEHERSMRNEAQIKQIWAEYSKLRDETVAAQNKLRDEMTAGFKEVNASISESNRTILGALAGRRDGFTSPSRGGRGGED